MRRLHTLVALALCVTTPAITGAQEKSAADLKKSGNEKMDAGDYVGALEDYHAALNLDPNEPTLRFNIARAEGLLGRNVEALVELDRFGQVATPEMKARAQFDLLYAQTKAKVAFLTVGCAIQGARVLLGQKVLGAAPFAHLPVDAAPSASLTFEAEGYLTDVHTVALPGAREATVQCRLLPKNTSGLLSVTTKPPGARIEVDGKPEKSSPTDVPLTAGAHVVTARLEGYEDFQVQVVVEAEQKKTVDLPLSKSVPVTARWWFWTGVGVVVVSGVVLTAALLTERPADKGTIEPKQLPAPLLRF
jgi:hypothetical protein